MNNIKDFKTAEEWFKQIPSERVKEKAIFNVNIVAKKRPKTAYQKYPTLSSAIKNSFPWFNTPEGFDYWNGVHMTLKNSSNESN